MKVSYEDRKLIRAIHGVKKWVQVKDMSDVPKSVIRTIKLISLPDQKAGVPFGSYMNRVSDYFGDIDVIQVADNFKDLSDVGNKTSKAIQEVVKEIKKKPNHWFSELKAGIDAAYYFDYGVCRSGVYHPSKELLPKSQSLFDMGLLSGKEIDVITKIASRVGDGRDYDVIFNLFREHFVLRWTEEEVLQGWKMISTGKYHLKQAVLDKSAVKIDMIVHEEGRKYIEVTNFIVLGLGKGKYFKPINVDRDLSPLNLPEQIEKLYWSDYHYSPFKLVKRAFAYLKWARNNLTKVELGDIDEVDHYIDRYVQVLKTSINILYTVKSELDAIRIVLDKKLTKSQMDQISDRIDLLKEPIANVLEIGSEDLDSVMGLIDAVVAEQNQRDKQELVVETMELFRRVINFWTIVYFDYLGINPPPDIVLGNPADWVYDHRVVRDPRENPINPFKAVKGGFFASLAKSAFQKAANLYRSRNKEKLPDGRPKVRPLMKGELHWKHGNFIGPGTRVDLPEIRDYPPYNDVDACARTHDLDYMKAIELPEGERQRAIVEADKKAVKCFAKYPDQEGSKVGQLGLNSKMKLGEVLPLVSNAIFGKISSGINGGKIPKPNKGEKERDYLSRCIPFLIREGYNRKQAAAICYSIYRGKKGGRNVSSIDQVTDPRLKAPGSAVTHLRPGEDPEVAKQAFKDAFGVVTSIFKEDPKGVVEGVTNIGKHLGDILSGKNLEPGWKYENGRIVQDPNYKGGCGDCGGTCGGKSKKKKGGKYWSQSITIGPNGDRVKEPKELVMA